MKETSTMIIVLPYLLVISVTVTVTVRNVGVVNRVTKLDWTRDVAIVIKRVGNF